MHSYQSGLGVEIMANSDNVIRAGLTPKHIDIDEPPRGRVDGAGTGRPRAARVERRPAA